MFISLKRVGQEHCTLVCSHGYSNANNWARYAKSLLLLNVLRGQEFCNLVVLTALLGELRFESSFSHYYNYQLSNYIKEKNRCFKDTN